MILTERQSIIKQGVIELKNEIETMKTKKIETTKKQD